MPSLPTPGDVHVNRPLTNIAIAFKQSNENFVAWRVFPQVNVEKQSDVYYVWDRADFHRDEAQEIGPSGEAPIGALRISTDSYFCRVNKFAHLISDQDRANTDTPLNLDKTKTEDVTRKLMIRMEKKWSAAYFTTGVWTGALGIGGGADGADLVGNAAAGANQFVFWSDYLLSDPVTLIRQQAFHLGKLGLQMKNLKLVVGAEAYLKLLDHPKILERIEQVQASILNEQIIASVLGIGEVIVPMAVETTSREGAATATMGYIHGKSALLVYAAPAPGIDVVSGGFMFAWTGLTGAQAMGIRIKRFRRELRDSDQIQGEIAFDPKLVSSVCGVFFSAAVA